ncbi:MAG: chalcone isomerase family protein [Undibacterium sp.]|uniref:chalcone isomerase family protein n=1 Tax=Undibacterium sp. TaxID=1914977 RepID=UPI00272482AD|nr:chalcone isomerase family protein [Undibacterium sp.]MDO8651260.1 chalcone isomerase family protein [Undibacterium sp.]
MKTTNYLNKCFGAACLAFSLLALGMSSGFAREVAGVTLDESIQVEGRTLVLNGAGISSVNRNKVFVLAYYLPKLKTTQQELLASTGPIRVKLVMLKAVESELMSRRFLADIRTSTTKEERIQLVSQLMALGEGFAAVGEWRVGDIMTIDWLAGKGTTFHSNNKQIGESLKNDLTMQAIMRIWVGDTVNDMKLKRLLLGDKE